MWLVANETSKRRVSKLRYRIPSQNGKHAAITLEGAVPQF